MAAPTPNGNRLLGRALLCVAALLIGAAWSSAVRQPADRGGPAEIAAALLVVVGLCGIIVTALQFYGSRK